MSSARSGVIKTVAHAKITTTASAIVSTRIIARSVHPPVFLLSRVCKSPVEISSKLRGDSYSDWLPQTVVPTMQGRSQQYSAWQRVIWLNRFPRLSSQTYPTRKHATELRPQVSMSEYATRVVLGSLSVGQPTHDHSQASGQPFYTAGR